MPLNGPATPPVGHVRFCDEFPEDCTLEGRPNQVVRLSKSALERLKDVNKAVNAAVLPATDMEVFGTLEHWTYPGLQGDCEDYVIQKRSELIRTGWPASALLITVVKDEEGAGHAVLTVRTDVGDLILDNKIDRIVAWIETPYRFVKRQSSRNPMSWDQIEDSRATAVGSVRPMLP
ncbi:transglutaminase-like cysteine peptidase [Chthonobacter rhizosphaerae]|uniref:transglutaminase-like cysteine peptidase n=1 Tax=Chthonobacter rhizosphaerae TaxID=2735553 RepID=UPI0015EE866F|nr:transglutaminase-like cysteine peptidase [Chthonobacter rhizosphaerae]